MEFKVTLEDIENHEEKWRSSKLNHAGRCLVLIAELKKLLYDKEEKIFYPIPISTVHQPAVILEVFQELTNEVLISIKPEGNQLLVTVGEEF